GVATRLAVQQRQLADVPPDQTRLVRSASPPACVADARESACPTPRQYAPDSGCSQRRVTAARRLRCRAMAKSPPCGPPHCDPTTTGPRQSYAPARSYHGRVRKRPRYSADRSYPMVVAKPPWRTLPQPLHNETREACLALQPHLAQPLAEWPRCGAATVR